MIKLSILNSIQLSIFILQWHISQPVCIQYSLQLVEVVFQELDDKLCVRPAHVTTHSLYIIPDMTEELKRYESCTIPETAG